MPVGSGGVTAGEARVVERLDGHYRGAMGHDDPTTAYVIFGAAVRADGSPSGSLTRRVEAAIAAGRDRPDAVFVPTGGVGRHGPAEAEVMRDLLERAGIAATRIIVEAEARDTLESVELCDALLRARGIGAVVPCSSGYHRPRCALLFRLLGYRVETARMPRDRKWLGTVKWLRYMLKEVVATPWDAVQIVLYRWRR